ncbi:putative DNA-binding pseudobarrel domain superfamily [Helianthus anomalus]
MNSWVFILPRNYYNLVANYKLAPDGMVRIITMDEKVLTVKIRKAGYSYIFFDNGSLTFRLIYFYQDLALAQGDFLYSQTSQLSEHKDHLLIDRFFVPHKTKNIIPTKHVTITAFPNHTWQFFMEKHGQNCYMATGWNRIKEDVKIQDEDFIVST